MKAPRIYLHPDLRRACKAIVEAGQEARFVFDPENPMYVELQSFLVLPKEDQPR